MLSTEKLEQYVYSEIQTKLGDVPCSNLFFTAGTDNSAEGTYIFSRDNKYHILFIEKGKIRKEIVTEEEREVLWNALDTFLFDTIMNYAMNNREKGKDFRRAFFAKEKELFAAFGNDFEKRKDEEIREILKRNPYNDI